MSGARRNWGARIREYEREGRRVVFLENRLLRVGIDAGRGTEVFECCYKPRDVDLAPITRPDRVPLGTTPDPEMAFVDTYAGGWQEVFPNAGAPSLHAGVRYGQHDEVWRLPWSYDVLADDEREVAVSFTVTTQRMPFRLTKEVRLREGVARLEHRWRVENLSPVPLHATWGHHIAFGPPFLREGCRVEVPDGVEVIPHAGPLHPEGRRVEAERCRWPLARAAGGGEVDLSRIPGPGAPSDIVYLTGFPEGWYELTDPGGLGVRVEWDAAVLPYLWFWQEFGATRGYPWYGRLHTIGLEPSSSWPTNGLAEAVANGSALLFEGGACRRLELAMEVRDG